VIYYDGLSDFIPRANFMNIQGNSQYKVALGGAVVSVLANGPKVAGPYPTENDGF
jgi:hypothetical protein